ncbi:MAG TPA: hypothetical protein VJN65_02940 [Bacteroidota bacterium]|nr:hypothetical protein [Bacteroidota bacterium]
MKKTLFTLLAALLFLVLTAGDCKKTTEPTGTAPTVPNVTFSLPALGDPSTDPCSFNAYLLVQFANLYSTQFAVFATLQPTSSGSDYTWSLPIDSLTVTVKATRQGDGSFTWEIKYNGVEDGITYANRVMASGSTSADGKSGSFTAYDDSSPGIVGTFTWSTSANNDVTGVFIENASPGGSPEGKIEVISHANGSGEVSTFTWSGSAWPATPDFHATWPSAGAPATCD